MEIYDPLAQYLDDTTKLRIFSTCKMFEKKRFDIYPEKMELLRIFGRKPSLVDYTIYCIPMHFQSFGESDNEDLESSDEDLEPKIGLEIRDPNDMRQICQTLNPPMRIINNFLYVNGKHEHIKTLHYDFFDETCPGICIDPKLISENCVCRLVEAEVWCNKCTSVLYILGLQYGNKDIVNTIIEGAGSYYRFDMRHHILQLFENDKCGYYTLKDYMNAVNRGAYSLKSTLTFETCKKIVNRSSSSVCMDYVEWSIREKYYYEPNSMLDCIIANPKKHNQHEMLLIFVTSDGCGKILKKIADLYPNRMYMSQHEKSELLSRAVLVTYEAYIEEFASAD